MPAAIPSVENLYQSAVDLARDAMLAHRDYNYLRVALYAGTAVEHLTKACLMKRHPTLVVDLQSGERSWASLLLLIGPVEGKTQENLRTVSLYDAINRVRGLFQSHADAKDLDLLVALRNGAVHVAQNQNVEKRVMLAFIQQVDASIHYLGKERVNFWGEWLPIVDALLTDATDMVERIVKMKLTKARADFEKRYGQLSAESQQAFRNLVCLPDSAQEIWKCPACESIGLAEGHYDFQVEYKYDHGEKSFAGAWYDFSPRSFACPMCGLDLGTRLELDAADIPLSWKSDLDPDYIDDIEGDSTRDR